MDRADIVVARLGRWDRRLTQDDGKRGREAVGPQVTLPLAEMGGCPLGLSLIAPSGRDRGLLEWVAKARS